jgi:hypothetical protein
MPEQYRLKKRPCLLETPMLAEYISRIVGSQNLLKIYNASSNCLADVMVGQSIVPFVDW